MARFYRSNTLLSRYFSMLVIFGKIVWVKRITYFFAFILLVGSLIYTRFFGLNTGVNIVEPDEWSYDYASKSVYQGPVPNVAGRPLLEQSPLFEYVAAGINLLVKDPVYPRGFVSIRLVSAISSFILGLSIFYYLYKKLGSIAALYGLGLYTFIPLNLYYSRLGLRETPLMLTLFWFYIFFERLKTSKTRSRTALWAGIFLGISVLVKTTALILFVIPAFYFVVSLLDRFSISVPSFNSFKFGFSLAKDYLKRGLDNGIVISAGLLISVNAFVPYAILYPSIFKDRLYLTFFSHNADAALTRFRTISYYLNHLDYWLTLPVIVLTLIGIVYLIWKRDFGFTITLFFSLVISYFLVSNEARGRYFVLLTPYLIVLASLGMLKLGDWISQLSKQSSYTLLPLAVLVVMLPQSNFALQSSQHSVLEQASSYLKSIYKNQHVFSNYWPQIIQYSSGIPIARLTTTMVDLSRDYNEFPTFSPVKDRMALDYLKDSDVIFVVTKPVEKEEFTERKLGIQFVEQHYQPDVVLTDSKPNFPEKVEAYKISVYNVINQKKENTE